MEFTVVTTGINVPIAAQRTSLVLNIVAAHKLSARVITRAQAHTQLRAPNKAQGIHALALWGLHHSLTAITPAPLSQRLGIAEERAQRLLVHWKKEGIIESCGPSSDQQYILTIPGKIHVDQWFSYITHGSLIHIRAKDHRHAAVLDSELRAKIPGIVTGASRFSRPSSSIHWALWLMLSWIALQEEWGVTSPSLARAAGVPRSTVRDALCGLVNAKLLFVQPKAHATGGLRGRPPTAYALTPRGEWAARQCLTSLLT